MSSDDGSLEHYREHIRSYVAQLSGGFRYEVHIDLCLKETFEQASQEVDVSSAGWETWLESRAKKVFLQHFHQFLAEDVSYYFTPMYILYEGSVRRKIEATLGAAKLVEAVDDCLQTTFERAFKTLIRRKPEDILRLDHFKAWLNTIAEHVVLDWKEEHPQQLTTSITGTKVRLTLILEPLELDIGDKGEQRSDIPDPEPLNQPEKVIEREAARKEVRECVIILPEKYRVPIQLHYFDGLKLEQVAERLGSPLGKVKSDASRGRSMLHNYMIVKWAVESDAHPSVQTYIDKLKDPHRMVLRLHFIDSVKLPDVAVRCKRSLDSVRRYLYYGVRIIAESLKKGEE